MRYPNSDLGGSRAQIKGDPELQRKNRGSVLSKVASGTELTTYVIRDIAFLGATS
jgi:hypothetical protein